MKGSIQKKGDIYYLVLSIGQNPETRKWKTRWIRSGTDKALAEEALAHLLVEQERDKFLDPEKITVKEFLTRWLANHVEPSVRESTYESYKWTVETFVTPYIGSIELKALSPLHLQDLLGRLRKRKPALSKTMLHYVYAVLRGALNRAVKWRLILNNPILAVDAPKTEKFRSSSYTPELLSSLLLAAKSTPLHLPIMLAATCGLRRGECCGLRWQDVALDRGLMFVRNSLNRVAGKLKSQPVKTQRSERSIRLPEAVITLLTALKPIQTAEKLEAGPLYQKLDYVWAYDNGTPHDPTFLSHAFLKLLRSEKLPLIRFHDLRHTHATMLLLEHVPVKTISERLGHSSTLITQDLYSHVLPEMQLEAANAMDRILLTPPMKKTDESTMAEPTPIAKFLRTKISKAKKKRNKMLAAKRSKIKLPQSVPPDDTHQHTSQIISDHENHIIA